MSEPAQSAVGHGALGLRSGLRDFAQFADEPTGTPQLWAEVRLGAPIVTTWEANSGCYRTSFYRSFDGVPLDVVAVQSPSQTLRRVESVGACAAVSGTYCYDDAGGAPNTWDSDLTWDTGVLWDVGAWLYVNVPTSELDGQTVIARVGFYFGTDGLTQPQLGPNILANGSFESWPGGVLGEWTFDDGGGGDLQQDTTARDGSYSARVGTPFGFDAALLQDGVSLEAGALYCLSGSYVVFTPSAGYAGSGIAVQVSTSGGDAGIVQADGRTTGSTVPALTWESGDYQPGSDAASDAPWRRFAFYFMAPTSAVRVKIRTRDGSSSSNDWIVDDVRLRRVHRWVAYEPRLTRDAAPTIDEGRADVFFGPWRVGQATLTLANDGLLETLLGQFDAIGGEVLLRQGGRFPGAEELTLEACRTVFVGRIQALTLTTGAASLELENTQGQLQEMVPRRSLDKSATPNVDERAQGLMRPLLFGYQRGMVPRRIDRTDAGLPVYELVDTDEWPAGIGLSHVPTARSVEVRLYQDDDAAQRGDTARSTVVTDHVAWGASGRGTALNCLKPVPIDEEHQFYTFTLNGGADLDVRLLDANEETVILTPTGTGAASNFSAVGAPTVHECVTTFGDSARAHSTSTTGVRRCEVTCAAMAGSAAVVSATLRAWLKTSLGADDDGDSFRFYVERSGVRYYSPAVDEPAGFYNEHTYTWDTDPSTGSAWTQTGINNAVWGVEYDPNNADTMAIDTLLPYVRRYKSTAPTASRPSIRTPKQHAALLQQAMLTAAALSSGIAVTFDETTFKYTITGSGSVTALMLKTKTGRQKSGWAAMGYGTDADKSGSLTYTSDVAYYDPAAEIDAPVLRVAAVGYVDDASGTYTGTAGAPIEKAPDVLRFILVRLLRVDPDRIDAASFVASRDTAKSMAVYIDEAMPLADVVQRIEQGEQADLVIDGDRYYFAPRATAWSAGMVELDDSELIGGVRSSLSSADVYGVVRVAFARDPGRQTWEAYELAPATNPRVRFGRAEAMSAETYLLEAADAAAVRDALLEQASAPRRVYSFAARGKLLRARIGHVVRLYPRGGGLSDANGASSPVDVRIYQRTTDSYTMVTTAQAVEV